MKFWLSCEVRGNGHTDYWGYALLVEWPSKRILDFYTSDPHVNKVSHQGIRGMVYHKGAYYAVWNNCVEVLWPDMTRVDVIQGRWLYGMHCWVPAKEEGTFWCDCEMRDSVIRVNREGDVQEEIILDDTFKPIDVDFRLCSDEQVDASKEAHRVDRLHINSIQFLSDGVMLVGCGRPSIIMQAKPEVRQVFDYPLRSPHNFYCMGEKVLACDSGRGTFVAFSKGTDEIQWAYVNRLAGVLHANAQVGWARGLLQIDEERVLVGSSPLSVYQININTCEVEDWAVFAGDVGHACHAVNVCGGE